jgi:hypothetical protein
MVCSGTALALAIIANKINKRIQGVFKTMEMNMTKCFTIDRFKSKSKDKTNKGNFKI